MDRIGYVVIYDTKGGTGAWGWYEMYSEAEEAEEECREELEITNDGWYEWTKIVPCPAYTNEGSDC